MNRQNLILATIGLFWLLSSCQNGPTPSSSVLLSSGSLQRIENFNSQYIRPRHIDVWLPDGYDSASRYNVLYMHDGQMLFDSTKTWNGQEWGVDESIGTLIDRGHIEPTIVVGIWNTEWRKSEYLPEKAFYRMTPEEQADIMATPGSNGKLLFPEKIQSDNYLKFIIKEIKPFIDSSYSTYPDKKHTYMAGSSMGGLISLYAICEYPEVFNGAACMSTHWTGIYRSENNPFPNAYLAYLKSNLPECGDMRIYFDYGTETLDSLYEPFQLAVDDILKQHNDCENWVTKKFEGADHSENAWKSRLTEPILFLMGKQSR